MRSYSGHCTFYEQHTCYNSSPSLYLTKTQSARASYPNRLNLINHDIRKSKKEPAFLLVGLNLWQFAIVPGYGLALSMSKPCKKMIGLAEVCRSFRRYSFGFLGAYRREQKNVSKTVVQVYVPVGNKT